MTPGKAPRNKSLAQNWENQIDSDATDSQKNADIWSLKSSYSSDSLENVSVISYVSGSTYDDSSEKRISPPRKSGVPQKIESKRLNRDNLAEYNELINVNGDNERVDQSVARVEQFLELYPINGGHDLKPVPLSVFAAETNKVTFLKSVFQGRAPTAFFQYPTYVGETRKSERTNIYSGEALEHLFMSFAFTEETDYFTAQINACKFAGFSEA